jgi:hypothetical protein
MRHHKFSYTQRLWHKRQRFYKEQNGCCYYCREAMVIYKPDGSGLIPDNFATFEHLDDRYSPERGKHPGKRRIFLACLKCNAKKAKEREREVGIEEIRRRSQGSRRPLRGSKVGSVAGQERTCPQVVNTSQ